MYCQPSTFETPGELLLQVSEARRLLDLSGNAVAFPSTRHMSKVKGTGEGKDGPGAVASLTYVVHQEDFFGVVLKLLLRPRLVHHPHARDAHLLSNDRHLRAHDGVADDESVMGLQPHCKSVDSCLSVTQLLVCMEPEIRMSNGFCTEWSWLRLRISRSFDVAAPLIVSRKLQHRSYHQGESRLAGTESLGTQLTPGDLSS